MLVVERVCQMLRVVCVAMLALGLVGIASPAGAASTPTCQGKVATQYLMKAGTLHFTSGDDVLVGSSGSDIFAKPETAEEVGGTDLVCGRGGDDTIQMWGSFGDSRAYGDAGDDFIYVQETATAYGGSGNDNLEAEFNAKAYGESGNDQLSSTDGTEQTILDGGSGNDRIVTFNNSGKIYGGSGRDNLNVFDSSLVDCGSGVDTYSGGNVGSVVRCEKSST